MEELQAFYFTYQLEIHLFAIITLLSLASLIVYSSKKKKNKTDDLFSQIVNDAQEQEAIIENNKLIDKQAFDSAFPDALNAIADDVNGVNREEKPYDKETQTIWVNWMLNIAGKVRLKQSTIVISGPWGTKSSIEQLKSALDTESNKIVNGQEYSWSVVLVSPLID